MTDRQTAGGRDPAVGKTGAGNVRGPASGFILRPVVNADLPQLFALDRICFEPGIAYSREEIRSFLALPTARGLALESGGTVVGFTIGYRPARRRGSVVTLDVHPDWRQRGAGRSLLSALVDRLERDGAREITLEVDVGNRRAIAFYERFGFRTVARLPGYYGAGRDANEMELRLPPPA
ncbi:MAG TPA: GNAT family N-acetyltransferase [Candidatus Eisenbacteria bacterium]